MSARGRAVGALAAAALLLPAALTAQAPRIGGVSAYTGFESRGVSFSSGLGVKSVSEFTVPFAVLWSPTARLGVDLGGRYASASRTDTLGTATISGLTDIQARATYQLVPDVAVFTVAANLPTGKAQFTADQLLVASAIASDLLPYPVTNFSSGFNVTAGLALAVPVGGWALGVAGSYRMNSGFTPLADTTASYKSGGEYRVRVGADRIVGQTRLSFGFTYSGFGEDQFASSPIFQSGKRYISQASWSFPVGNLGFTVYAWDLYRAAGSQLFSGGLVTPKRNVFAVGAASSLQLGPSVLRPLLEFRSYTLGSSQLMTAGQLLTLGATYQLPLGQRFVLLPTARFNTGNENVLAADGNPTGATVGLTGWQLGVTLRAAM